MNDIPALASLNCHQAEFTGELKQTLTLRNDQGPRSWHSRRRLNSPIYYNLGSDPCRDDYGDRLHDCQRSPSTALSAREALGYSSDSDDDESPFFPSRSWRRPSKSVLMDNNGLSPDARSNGLRRRRRSIPDRVTALISLRRGLTSASRSRAGSDISNPSTSNSPNVSTPRTGTSRDQSAYTTDDEHESSEEVHSIEDSSEFGLLEDDPFANLGTPSGPHSPLSRLWFASLSSEVIQEEPEEILDKASIRMSLRRPVSSDAVQTRSRFSDDEAENDGDVSMQTQDQDEGKRGWSVDGHERKRANSLTQRVRNMVHSRPSLPSLSLLATTKIFLPTSKSVLAGRFPSEPWDDPKYTTDPVNYIRTTSSQKGGSRSGGYTGNHHGHFNASEEDGGFPSYPSPYRAAGGSGGGAGGNGRDDRQPPNRSGGNSRSTSEDNTTEDAASTSSEDDLPLGQRPNALDAQKSLRKKIKDERRSRKDTIQSVSRPIAKSSVTPHSRIDPTLADDLTARLLHLRSNAPYGSLPTSPNGRTTFPTLPCQSSSTSPPTHKQISPTRGHSHPSDFSAFPSAAPDKISSSSKAPISNVAFPSGTPLKRHVTDSHAHHNYMPDPRLRMPERSMTSFDSPRSGVAPAYPNSRRPSLQYEAANTPQKRTRADTLIQKIKSPSLPTAAKIRARANSLHTSKSNGPPPLPPLPPPVISNPSGSLLQDPLQNASQNPMMQQRIFIGDLQRYTVVEIGARTNAREVLKMVEENGSMTVEELGDGQWMLFEMANDFGMERPIREFELVIETYNSWNSDMRMNYFMLKRTPLTSFLAAENISKSSPTHGGYVEWEHKRSKWTKRWLELREHCLWISKKQGAKDATLLCTLSNFDAYLVTRLHKSPRPFIFSMKSVQNMRLFERPQDYHHVFCCDPEEGRDWLQNILLARSYVLRQERAILFHQIAPVNTSHQVARSTTRRTAPAPLLNMPVSASPLSPTVPKTPREPSATAESFKPVPGSLLAKRA